MPWLIQHVCHEGQDPQPYAILTGGPPEMPLTRFLCGGECREEFFVLGDDMFKEAHPTRETQPGRDLPPGFVIARTKIGG